MSHILFTCKINIIIQLFLIIRKYFSSNNLFLGRQCEFLFVIISIKLTFGFKLNNIHIFFHMQHYPSHINGLILLADINVNHLKNLDVAEEVFAY